MNNKTDPEPRLEENSKRHQKRRRRKRNDYPADDQYVYDYDYNYEVCRYTIYLNLISNNRVYLCMSECCKTENLINMKYEPFLTTSLTDFTIIICCLYPTKNEGHLIGELISSIYHCF